MRVAVAMSAGVNSSFAALSVKNEGHEVPGGGGSRGKTEERYQ